MGRSDITEPQKDEDGTYLISTGAELAWFAQEVNSVAAKSTSTINGKLTKDIDLASHNFPQIGYFNGGTEYVIIRFIILDLRKKPR